MANELKASGLTSGSTYYVTVRAGATYLNGSSFEAYTPANFASYAVAAGTANSCGDWVGTFPAIAAGDYSVTLRQRAGGSAAVTDTVMAGPSTIRWTGTAETSGGETYVGWAAVGLVTSFPIVLPFTATSVNPGPTLNNIRNLYQYSAPSFQWTILDATGAAVSLSGKSIQLKVYTDDGTTRTTRYTYTTTGGTVTISGAGNNVVAVTFSATHTASVYPNLRYELQNTTDKLVLAAGSIDMVPAMDMT